MLALACLLAIGSPVPAVEEGYISLSEDPALSAWRLPKPGAWEWKEGVLRRLGGGTIWTRHLYEDFTLRLEFRIPQGGNSGVYLRAPLSGRQSALGMEVQVLGDYGTPPGIESCGSLYAARAPDVAANRPDGEWNELEVLLIGRQLKVTLNGQVIHDLSLDDPAANAALPYGLKLSERGGRGFIGLQDHGAAVEYRNVRLKPEAEAGFEPLFDGTLTGWTPSAEGVFAVTDGVLTCTAPEQGEPRLKCARVLGDYELRLEFRAEAGAQLLWLLRTDDNPRNNPVDVVIGDDSGQAPGVNATGALFGNAGTVCRGSLPPGEWNDLRLLARGRMVECYLNGMPVLPPTNTNQWSRYMYAPLNGTPEIAAKKGKAELRGIRVKPLGP